LSVVFDDLVVGLGQKTCFPNQVRQAKLHEDGRTLHIGPIRTVVIRSQKGFTFFSQNVFEDLCPSGVFDGEHGEGGGSEHPIPHLLSVVKMARLVDVEAFLVREGLEEFLIRNKQSPADFAHGFGQHPCA